MLEGWVHLIRSSDANDATRAVVLFTVTPNDVLCGISAIEDGRYHLSAVTGTTCRIVRLPGAMVRKALMH